MARTAAWSRVISLRDRQNLARVIATETHDGQVGEPEQRSPGVTGVDDFPGHVDARRVEGKVAIVTGGGSGLGEADAVALAAHGAQVIVTDVNEEGGARVADAIGGIFLRQDVTDEKDWQRVIGTTLERFGQLDVLVNNAGVSMVAGLADTTLEQYRSIQRVNSDGVFLGCKAGVEAMGERGGSIINISSMSAIRGFPAVVAYAASKGAVLSLSMTVAASCINSGYPIRSNVILPGATSTPLERAMTNEGSTSQSVGVATRRKVGEPADIANLVLFLASDESKHITGQQFVVDGGYSIL